MTLNELNIIVDQCDIHILSKIIALSDFGTGYNIFSSATVYEFSILS